MSSVHGRAATDARQDDQKRKPGSSKYDFIKVRVTIGEHYYVLSRFILSRMLMSVRIGQLEAIRLALRVKKKLVDANRLEVTQRELEEDFLFCLMRSRGFGDKYVGMFRMLRRFYHTRVPMMILILGPRRAGKSTIAMQLSERMNVPFVVQTDIIYELMSGKSMLDASDADLMETWADDCAVVQRGIVPEVLKVLKDGKGCIFEGMHVDPVFVMAQAQERGSSLVVPFLLQRGPLSPQFAAWERHCICMDLSTVSFDDCVAAMHKLILKKIRAFPLPDRDDG